ncbi:Uncharacterised protein [uncultured archaeon]|nr:Uncharacterised protein [uncultured archaeon]
MNLREEFEVGDLKLILEPKIHIDEYQSKLGKDDEICVISFIVKDKTAAIDLADFFEKGYDFILDADVSASEIIFGSYLVFIEVLRRQRIIDELFEIISDLQAASELKLKDWKFKYITEDHYHSLTKEELEHHVPLSPRAYFQIMRYFKALEEQINFLKRRAGLHVYKPYQKTEEIETLQRNAGISIDK